MKTTRKKYWWKCKKNPVHRYKQAVRKKTERGQSCPYCAGRLVDATNSLISMYPEIGHEYDDTKNKVPCYRIHFGSTKKVWFTCSTCTYSYKTVVYYRNGEGTGCPKCAGKVITQSNSLAGKYPDIAKKWEH